MSSYARDVVFCKAVRLLSSSHACGHVARLASSVAGKLQRSNYPQAGVSEEEELERLIQDMSSRHAAEDPIQRAASTLTRSPNEAFQGILARLGLNASIGNNFRPDPLLRKQLTEENQQEVLETTMTPLVNLSYEDQLRFKHHRIKSLGRNISKTLSKKIPNLYLDEEGLMFPVDPVVPSPYIAKFRNKDELCVGVGVDGYPKRVGYFIGRSKADNLITIFPENIVNMRDSHKLLGKMFEEYIATSPLPGHKVTSGGSSGYWKQIIARSTKSGDLMGIVIMHPQDMTEEQLKQEREKLKDYFVNGPGSVCQLKSLYFQACAAVEDLRKRQVEKAVLRPDGTEFCFKRTTGPHQICSPLQAKYHLLFGKEYLIEKCGHMKFRVSPSAFFQLNVDAAERLYRKIGELLKPDQNSVLLDVCCGTGAIGLFLASRFDKVVGVESDLLAVGDANFNADLNRIDNAEYYCGRAEKLIPFQMKNRAYNYSSISAVVNPGRAGLPSNVINALRKTPQVDKVVYVSCKPIGNAMSNILNLCLPTSKTVLGEPFFPTRIVPVDLFPNTDHCELVIMFERNRLFYI